MNLNGESSTSDNLPDRVEGWLNVLDTPGSGDISLLLDKARHLQWRPMYCVLRISSHRLSHSRNEDRGLQKKGLGPSVLKIGGTLDELLKSTETLNQQDDLDGKERNLFSFGGGNSLEDNSTNRFKNFINRTSSHIKGNLRRTRSSSKLDRRKVDEASMENSGSGAPVSFLKRTRSFGRLSKRIQSKWRGIQDRNDSPPDKDKSLRTAQSHESLVGHQPVINLTTFNSNTDIRVLHQSTILLKDNCFLISSDKTSRFYSCSTSSQMSIWLNHLKRSLDPIRKEEFRNLKSLSVLISEAKNLSSKSRYFCELVIDGQVYGRTTTKAKGEMLFWGEDFNFRNLISLDKGEKLMINIFQDNEKKKKKDLSILIGYLYLQLSDLGQGQSQEKWFPIRLVSDKNREADVSIRIKVKYQSLEILPLNSYVPFLKFLDQNYTMIISEMEQLLSAKEKEEFSILLVNVFKSLDKSEKFLVDVVMSEVDKQEKLENLLRSNSIASKSMDAFMKLVSEKYLKQLLGSFIASLVDPNLNLEVDNISSGSELQRRQERMLKFCNSACLLVFASSGSDDKICFPAELKKVFTSLKKRLMADGHGNDIVNQVISSCFFLRFICPAIMSPSLFGLTRVLPQDKEARNCTLVAKAIQGLANFTRFGEGKEEAMTFLNEFVEARNPKLKKFINEISNSSEEVNERRNIDVDIGLDLSRDLSLLHGLLKEMLKRKPLKLNKTTSDLSQILSDLDESLNEQRNSVKPVGSADSLEDLTTDDDGTSGRRRRTMREIHDSGSYISFTSLQNISDLAFSGNGFDASTMNQRLAGSSASTEINAFDKFSVSSASQYGKASDNNGSSSCLDVRNVNAIGMIGSSSQTRKSNIWPSATSDNHKISKLEESLQNISRETYFMAKPQRATLVYAAETEIDCNDNATTFIKPLTPQGNVINNPAGKLQITFNIPKHNDAPTDKSPFGFSSLKRPQKDQQPLIFSNPGFGIKSSLSQTSLKMDASPSSTFHQIPNLSRNMTSMPPNCESNLLQKEILGSHGAMDDDNIFESHAFNSELNCLQEYKHPKDSTFSSSRSMEFTISNQTSSTSSFPNDLKNNISSDVNSCPSPGDASFSGRGDIGFNIKSGVQSWGKVPGIATIPRKMEGNKDFERQMSAQKSSIADLKWMLQQEREARSRMESEYERRLRISEQERKRMEAKAFEDKKLIDSLQRQLKEERERATELEEKLHGRCTSLDNTQHQTAVNKAAKRWPSTMSSNVGSR